MKPRFVKCAAVALLCWALEAKRSMPDVYDLLIVGAGPAGISASLRAIENKLNYLTVDEGEIGGTPARSW